MGEQNLHRFKAESAGGGIEAGKFMRRGKLPELHGDGLLKFQGCSHELSHLAAIVLQLVIVLAVGQVKYFHSDKFDLKLFDLFESDRRESGFRFAAEHLADEDRESAAVGKHGLVHDLNWQAVAKRTARD